MVYMMALRIILTGRSEGAMMALCSMVGSVASGSNKVFFFTEKPNTNNTLKVNRIVKG